ncbi:MAG: hypothetical protein MUE69_29115 [Myxococcota bacterium]|jgi:hypothetical protein|nr:hypothetical protein [Myxococcota bacterium]
MNTVEERVAAIRTFESQLRTALLECMAHDPEAFTFAVTRPEFDQYIGPLESALEGLKLARTRVAELEEELAALRAVVETGESFEKVAAKIFELRAGGAQ